MMATKRVFEDDRTGEQRQTHTLAVIGTDSFMSGWGGAEGGLSYAGWACTPEQLNDCREWVEGRSEMKRVRVIELDSYRPTAKHTHIYVYDGQRRKYN